MEMSKCQKCGKEFASAHALKIHDALQHGKRRTAKAGPKRKPGRPPKKPLVCKTCGRTFRMPAHLARHASVAHGKPSKASKARKVRKVRKVRKLGRPAGRRAPLAAAPAGLDIRSLTVDQLLALKEHVDARLSEIATQMRAARIRL
jgi:uncharacterized Zn-finger protein